MLIETACGFALAMSQEASQHRLTEPADSALSEYHAVSAWAVMGLIFGLLSPLAFVDPLIWAIPIIGALICCRALWQIRLHAPAMSGRKIALVGLWLSLFSLAAAPTDWSYYRWLVRDEARQTTLFWFDLLAGNRPEAAFQFTLAPIQRKSLNENLWDFYNKSDDMRKALENYVAPAGPDEPPRLVRTLLALGRSADVRYVSTLWQDIDGDVDILQQIYAVTFNESGEKKTLFVAVRLARIVTADGRAVWRIMSAEVGVDRNGNKPS
jgi:hypothetical protein